MQTIVTDDRGVCPSVSLSRSSTRLCCTKTSERIKILFVVNTVGGPRNIVLDGNHDPPQRGERKVGEIFSLCGPTTYLKNWLRPET